MITQLILLGNVWHAYNRPTTVTTPPAEANEVGLAATRTIDTNQLLVLGGSGTGADLIITTTVQVSALLTTTRTHYGASKLPPPSARP